MDNDNEIKEDVKSLEERHNEVMLFLGDEVKRIHQKTTNNSYDIEQEYAKTKKNHSPVNFLVLFGAFIVVICTVFFLNRYISVKDQEIKVSLDEFEDLNLNNLLNTVAAAQLNYDNALKTKLTLEAEMETKLNTLKSDLENNIYILDSLNLSNKNEYKKRKNKFESEYKEGVESVNKEYESQILLAEKQVAAYKAQLDEFDSVKVANAQEKEKLLNSERQLRQLEIDKLTKNYEARIKNMDEAIKNLRVQHSKEMREAVHNVATKYQAEIDTLDPKLNDIRANLIIGGAKKTDDFNGPFQLVAANVEKEEVIKAVKDYQKLYDDYKYLDDVVKSIPQKYSIPKYVTASRDLVNTMSKTYLDSSIAYFKHIENKNEVIGDLNTKLREEKIRHEQIMEETSRAHEKELADAQIEKENAVSNMYELMGIEALLINAAGYENIQVQVDPRKTSLIPPEGISGRINTRKPIYGKIIKNENGAYYFEVEKDSKGEPKRVDFDQLVPGTIVEIVW